MKKVLVSLLSMLLFIPGAFASAADDSYDKLNVMDTLETMARAYVKKDLKTLDSIYHAALMYGHTDGEFETKAQVLEVITFQGYGGRDAQPAQFKAAEARGDRWTEEWAGDDDVTKRKDWQPGNPRFDRGAVEVFHHAQIRPIRTDDSNSRSHPRALELTAFDHGAERRQTMDQGIRYRAVLGQDQ